MSQRGRVGPRAVFTLPGVGAALAVFVLVGCGSATAPTDAPEGHTEVHGGVAHGSGAAEAATRCVSCHGATLQGGSDGEPSCFSCHGKKWK